MIPEDRFGDLFATLPVIPVSGRDYKPLFDFGSHTDLLRYMNSERKAKGGVQYPLIWLETPFKWKELRNGDIRLTGLKFILATLSNSELSNKERLEVTFKPTLYPFYDDVKKSLKYGGFTTIVGDVEIEVSNFYNYGVDESQTQTTDIWDAISFESDIIMTNRCLRDINY